MRWVKGMLNSHTSHAMTLCVTMCLERCLPPERCDNAQSRMSESGTALVELQMCRFTHAESVDM